MIKYEVEVAFDDRVADVVNQRTYFDALDKYDAVGMGHDRTGTSSMFILSEKPLSIDELTKNLGDIEILRISEN